MTQTHTEQLFTGDSSEGPATVNRLEIGVQRSLDSKQSSDWSLPAF